jgi:hypothetical protein
MATRPTSSAVSAAADVWTSRFGERREPDSAHLMRRCTGPAQLLGAGRSTDGADLNIVDVSWFPRLAADSVIETEMGSEVPRDAAKRDHCDEEERDQGDEQSDGARPGADRCKGEGQK